MQPQDLRFGQPLKNSGVYYERNLKPYEEQNGIDGGERREPSQSSDSKSDALSIRPRGHVHEMKPNRIYLLFLLKQ